MDAAAEAELYHVEDPFTFPSGLLDLEMPLASVHDLVRDPQLNFPYFDFSTFESRELSPKQQGDTSSSTDNLSNLSAPSLITNHSSISSHPEVTITRDVARDGTPCQNPQGSCIKLATRVLSSMHAGSNSCVLSMIGQDEDRQPQPLQGADTGLNSSQSAIAAVSSILQCSCCGAPQVLLLVNAICSKTGASYRQVVDIYSQRCKPNERKAETQRKEFFIGNHRLSQDVEAVVIRQVLVGRLRELEVVIGDIDSQARQSPAVNDSRSNLMLSGVRARMVALLQTQVRALTSALNHLEGDVATSP
ncbi:MAG: hypothetical protein LQ337_005298 [Flavoplaca oasis]|nr:MAG: hypothetical protein LQ337_005298 [Flavoplaca oasis]